MSLQSEALDGHWLLVDAQHAGLLAGRGAGGACELREVVGVQEPLQRPLPLPLKHETRHAHTAHASIVNANQIRDRIRRSPLSIKSGSFLFFLKEQSICGLSAQPTRRNTSRTEVWNHGQQTNHVPPLLPRKWSLPMRSIKCILRPRPASSPKYLRRNFNVAVATCNSKLRLRV